MAHKEAHKEATARWDFRASRSEELTVRAGETLMVMDDHNRWWRVANETGMIGYVPSNYLKIKEKKTKGFGAFTSLFKKDKDKEQHASSSTRPTQRASEPMASTSLPTTKGDAPSTRLSGNETQYGTVTELQRQSSEPARHSPSSMPAHVTPTIAVRAPSLTGISAEDAGPRSPATGGMAPPGRLSNPNRRSMLEDMGSSMDDEGADECSIVVRCAWDFEALTPDELSLRKGDIVTVLQKDGGEWWLGMVSGREGWFPWKYVEDTGDQSQGRKLEVVGHARATHDFHSDYRSEVSFARGEVMEVYGRVNDDWIEVRVAGDASRVGIVPANYVVMSSGSSSPAPAMPAGRTRRKTQENMPLPARGNAPQPSAPPLPRGSSVEDDGHPHGQPVRRTSVDGPTSYASVRRPSNDQMYPSLHGLGNAEAGQAPSAPLQYAQVSHQQIQNAQQAQAQAQRQFPARRASRGAAGQYNNENPPPIAPRRPSEDGGAGLRVGGQPGQRPVSMADPTMGTPRSQQESTGQRPASFNGAVPYENWAVGDPLASKPWFFGRISRPQSEQLLMERGSHQDYLVRESETKPGDYTISLRVETTIKHFRIASGANGTSFLIGTREFGNLEDLVHFYHSNPICLTPSGRVMLGHPLPK